MNRKKRYTLGINNKSRVNASYKMIENVQGGPFTRRTKDTIISSKISEFARGLKIPSGKNKKASKYKTSNYKK